MSVAEAELFEGFDRFALTVSPDDEPDVVAGVRRWLRVRVDVRAGTLAWSEEDACLTVKEARRLVAWMRAQAEVASPDASEAPEARCRFKESSLQFERRGDQVTVTLDLELTPLGAEGPCEVRLPFDPAQARAFADALAAQLDHLPEDDEVADGPLIPPPPRFRRPPG